MALSSGPGSQALPPQSSIDSPHASTYLNHPLVTAEATGDAMLAQSEHNGNACALATIDNVLPAYKRSM